MCDKRDWLNKVKLSRSIVWYGAAHDKYLKQGKINALKESKGCFDVMMILSPQSTLHKK